ncbi:type 1 glutamine amidotransferase [Thalassolituus sp.]|jgi:GMP synthase-like glutamine amidotransferase|uniref:type 1 glutamine amidotransferase n=1 Tax=Thalassolituus sp. TaxID=2030822 RepID=UPI002A81CCEF|nr:type 1 glutamine amidotransferase [Thalassolituus sp.]
MRAHYLQHVSFEGLGSIESWLINAGYEISNTPLYSSAVFPDIESIDFLVVMGGPMSVNDEAEYPWLAQEKDFIKQAIDLGIPVLGICLGAQLIADTMGGKVFPNTVKEIGWFPITAVNSETSSTFQFPKEIDVFHWHGETFSLPEGAVQIAKSRGCENQAFQLGSNVIGLQFHLETTPVSSQAIVTNCRDELVAGEYIQSEAEILAAAKESYTSINSLMARVLEYLHEAR